VLVAADGVSRHGIEPDDLLPGITVADGAEVAQAIADAEAVLTW
jgi:predicted peroxiredoxin